MAKNTKIGSNWRSLPAIQFQWEFTDGARKYMRRFRWLVDKDERLEGKEANCKTLGEFVDFIVEGFTRTYPNEKQHVALWTRTMVDLQNFYASLCERNPDVGLPPIRTRALSHIGKFVDKTPLTRKPQEKPAPATAPLFSEEQSKVVDDAARAWSTGLLGSIKAYILTKGLEGYAKSTAIDQMSAAVGLHITTIGPYLKDPAKMDNTREDTRVRLTALSSWLTGKYADAAEILKKAGLTAEIRHRSVQERLLEHNPKTFAGKLIKRFIQLDDRNTLSELGRQVDVAGALICRYYTAEEEPGRKTVQYLRLIGFLSKVAQPTEKKAPVTAESPEQPTADDRCERLRAGILQIDQVMARFGGHVEEQSFKDLATRKRLIEQKIDSIHLDAKLREEQAARAMVITDAELALADTDDLLGL